MMKEGKQYPQIDEEDGSCMNAAESNYGAAALARIDTDALDKEVVYGVAPGTFGFYTNDPTELRQHVEEMEAEISAPDTKWISSEEMWKELKQEFSWLV